MTAGLLRVDDSRGVPAPAFAHPLIAAAVYDQIGPARRARLHARAAELAEDEASRAAPPRGGGRGPGRRARRPARGARGAQGGGAHAAVGGAGDGLRLAPERRPARRARRGCCAPSTGCWCAGDVAHARAFARRGRRRSPRARGARASSASSPSSRATSTRRRRCSARPGTTATRTPTRCWPRSSPTATPTTRCARCATRTSWCGAGARSASRPGDPLTIGWTATLALSLWRLGRTERGLPHAGGAPRPATRAPTCTCAASAAGCGSPSGEIEAARADLEAAAGGRAADRLAAVRLDPPDRALAPAVRDRRVERRGRVRRARDGARRRRPSTRTRRSCGGPRSPCPPPAATGPPPTRTRGWPPPSRSRPPIARSPLGMTRALVATARGDAEAVLAALEPVAALSPNPGIDEPGFWPWHDLYGDALVGARARRGGRRLPAPARGAGGRARPRGADRQARPGARAGRGDARPARAGRPRRSSARWSTWSRSGCRTSRR